MKIWTEGMEKLWRSFISEKEQEKAADTEKPSYNQIYLAYSRCFVERDGVYYVGNHRLVDNFNPEMAVATLALSEIDGSPLPIKVIRSASTYKCTLLINTTGEILNNNIRIIDVPATFQNFAGEISREYEKHLEGILKEQGRD